MFGFGIILIIIGFSFYNRRVNNINSISTQSESFINIENDVRFDLYTLNNPSEAQILVTNDTNFITASNYNPKNPTRIFIHGYRSAVRLTSALKKGNFIQNQYFSEQNDFKWFISICSIFD